MSFGSMLLLSLGTEFEFAQTTFPYSHYQLGAGQLHPFNATLYSVSGGEKTVLRSIL